MIAPALPSRQPLRSAGSGPRTLCPHHDANITPRFHQESRRASDQDHDTEQHPAVPPQGSATPHPGTQALPRRIGARPPYPTHGAGIRPRLRQKRSRKAAAHRIGNQDARQHPAVPPQGSARQHRAPQALPRQFGAGRDGRRDARRRRALGRRLALSCGATPSRRPGPQSNSDNCSPGFTGTRKRSQRNSGWASYRPSRRTAPGTAGRSWPHRAPHRAFACASPRHTPCPRASRAAGS